MSIDDIKPRGIHELYNVSDPNIAERVILDLAALFHCRAIALGMAEGSAISYNTQVIAASFYEQLGLEESLKELAKGE